MSDLPFDDAKPISYEIWLEAVDAYQRARRALKNAEERLFELLADRDTQTAGNFVVMRDHNREGGVVLLPTTKEGE